MLRRNVNVTYSSIIFYLQNHSFSNKDISRIAAYLLPSAPLATEEVPKMNLPAEQSIEKAVERRRSAEAARKARIFNTRLRVMGIDTNALSKQVEDRKHSENMEMQCNKAFGKLITPIKFQQFCDKS